MPGEIEVILRCPPRPLLERVKNVDRLGELGDVEDAVLCVRVDSDLLDARPGFQSFGSRPRCTRQSWNPAICRAASGKPLILSRESPSQISGFSAMTKYTRTWMLRQRPAGVSLRYGRHPKASETPPP